MSGLETIAAINAAPKAHFMSAFADVAERSPWVARGALEQRPFADRDAMITTFADVIRNASLEQQTTLLRAHPDLAGRAALAGELTDDSSREQTGAGLDNLTPDEFEKFTRLNQEYRGKFEIPFIIAVRGATKNDIIAGFKARVSGTYEDEFRIALEQVSRIVRFRLEDRVAA